MPKEKAYGKINLFLNVVNKRFDGYHDLEMVMASVNLFDVLSFKPRKDGSITVSSDKPITEEMKDNLVYQVASHLQQLFDVKTGADIHITKNIPIAGGLAGGSADAAATLRGLNKLWKLKLSLDELAKIGLEFGSDIPFCIYNKLCIAKGRGEDLAFLDNKLNFPVLIVNPHIRISTKEVFSRVREEHLKEHKIAQMAAGIYNRNLAIVAQELHNSLEEIVFEMEPTIKDIKTQMVDWGMDGALMSGSGSTVFGISQDKNALKNVMQIMNENYFVTLTKIR